MCACVRARALCVRVCACASLVRVCVCVGGGGCLLGFSRVLRRMLKHVCDAAVPSVVDTWLDGMRLPMELLVLMRVLGHVCHAAVPSVNDSGRVLGYVCYAAVPSVTDCGRVLGHVCYAAVPSVVDCMRYPRDLRLGICCCRSPLRHQVEISAYKHGVWGLGNVNAHPRRHTRNLRYESLCKPLRTVAETSKQALPAVAHGAPHLLDSRQPHC